MRGASLSQGASYRLLQLIYDARAHLVSTRSSRGFTMSPVLRRVFEQQAARDRTRKRAAALSLPTLRTKSESAASHHVPPLRLVSIARKRSSRERSELAPEPRQNVWVGDAWSKETRRASLLFCIPNIPVSPARFKRALRSDGTDLAVDEQTKSSSRASSREGRCGSEEPGCFAPFRNPISRRRPLTARDLLRRIAQAGLLKEGIRRLLSASTGSPPQHAAAP